MNNRKFEDVIELPIMNKQEYEQLLALLEKLEKNERMRYNNSMQDRSETYRSFAGGISNALFNSLDLVKKLVKARVDSSKG